MLLHVDHDVKVPRRTSLGAGLSLVLDPQPRTVVHPRRNLDLEDLFFSHTSLPLAGFARVSNNLAATLALAAGAADREEPLLVADLAGSVASLAHDRIFSLGSSPPVAA